MYVFFDTETNGLPKKYNGDPRDLDNWPRVIQLAFIVLDENMKEIDSYCQLIKPDGWTIPTVEGFLKEGFTHDKALEKAKFWIDNGYSTEKNEAEGVPSLFAFSRLVTAIQSQYVIAHNMEFDYPIVVSEMIRLKLSSASKPKRLCTMKASTNYCAIPQKNGRGVKWPKLEELHTKLFGVSFDGAHDALEDVRETVRCFRELVERRVMSLDN